GRTTGAFRTDINQVGSWEKFRLWLLEPLKDYAIQTMTGNYVTVVDAGGRTQEPVLQTDQTQIPKWGKFVLSRDQAGYFSFKVPDARYLTAIDGGGRTVNPFYTVAFGRGDWEKFRVWKCGDLGTGYQYALVLIGPGYLWRAVDGGGRTTDAIRIYDIIYDDWAKFRLIRQDDGSYALQTS